MCALCARHGRPRSWASRMHAGNMARCEGAYAHPVCACALGHALLARVWGAATSPSACWTATLGILSALAFTASLQFHAQAPCRIVSIHTAVLSRNGAVSHCSP